MWGWPICRTLPYGVMVSLGTLLHQKIMQEYSSFSFRRKSLLLPSVATLEVKRTLLGQKAEGTRGLLERAEGRLVLAPGTLTLPHSCLGSLTDVLAPSLPGHLPHMQYQKKP